MRLIFVSLVVLTPALDAAAQTPTPTAPAQRKTLSLTQLVRDSLEHNLTLTSARASTRSTETAVPSAKSAFDPQLDFSPSYSRTSQTLLVTGPTSLEGTAPHRVYSGGASGQTPLSTSYSVRFNSDGVEQNNPAFLSPGILNPLVNNTLSFSLSQPLLKGFGPKYANAPVDLAEYTAESAVSRLQRSAEQTIADVEIAYWSLGLAEAVERLSRDSYTRADELMSRNEKMLELKLISEFDAITSRRGLQQRLTSLTDAVRRRQDAAERLLFLVYGRGAVDHLAERDAIVTEPPPTGVEPPPTIQEIETLALARRHDYAAARTDLSQAELQTSVNKNALLPDLRLTGTYTRSVLNTDAVRFFGASREGDLDTRDWKFGVTMTYPIGNRGARAAYARSRYDAQVQSENLAQFENLVRSQARASARAIETNRARLEQAQRSFDYAKQQYDAGQRQLQLGLLDSFRLLQMEEDVSTAELVLEQTRYDLVLAVTDFGLATGTIDDKYGVPELAR